MRLIRPLWFMVSEGHGWDSRNERAITAKDGSGPVLGPIPSDNAEGVQVHEEGVPRSTRPSSRSEALPVTPATYPIEGSIGYRLR